MELYERALDVFKKIISTPEAEVYHLTAISRCMYCLMQMADYEKYLISFNKYIEKFPNSSPNKAELFYFAGISLQKLHKYKDSTMHFNNALKSKPGNWEYTQDTLNLLSINYLNTANPKKAAETLLRLAEISNNTDTFIAAANNYMKSGDIEKTEKIYKKILEKNDLPPTISSKIIIKYAELKMNNSLLKEAESLLDHYLNNNKNNKNASVYLLSGYTKLYQEKYSEAEKLFTKAGKNAREAEKILSKLYIGYIKLVQNKLNDGLEILSEIFKKPSNQWPDIPQDTSLYIAKIFFQKGLVDISSNIYNKITEDEANNTNSEIYVKGALGQAACLRNTGLTSDAIKKLYKLLKKIHENENLKHFDSDIRSCLGEYLIQEKKNTVAVSMFEAVLKNASTSVENASRSTYGLAEIFFQEKDYNNALRYANSTFILYNNDYYAAKAMIMTIRILLIQKKRENAIEAWKELQQSYPITADKFQKEDIYINSLQRWQE